MKINKKEILNEKAVISYAEIIIMIISIFAFAYLVYLPTKEAGKELERQGIDLNKIAEENNKPGLLTILLAGFVNQFTKPMIQEVSATTGMYTCKLDKNGGKCQEYLPEMCDNKCTQTCFPGPIESFADCKPGCCIDSTGKCMVNSPEYLCENRGTWQDSSDCSGISECNLGCCVLGTNVRALVTETECGNYSAAAGFQVDWRQGMNEPDCLALSLTQAKGACVLGNSCKSSTEQECDSLNGKFAIGLLCTNPILNVTCRKTENTKCLTGENIGKDGVYFVDSCGNVANIYDSNKLNDEDYWNRIYSLDERCNPSSNNINSPSCGNCDYFLGSRCGLASDIKPDKGDYICKDMNCKDAPDNNNEKKDRKNGESWCMYDGAIGGGKDLVGSRHFRYNCINGEVKVEPCGDYRNSICVQSETSDNSTNIEFSTASCRLNQWQVCLEGSKCNKNPDCQKKTLEIGEYPKFDVCVPKYPEGFDMKTEAGQKSAKTICSQAAFTCTVIYQKKLFEGWVCIKNCECLDDSKFAKDMSDWCTSLGDCGFKKNIANVCTKNYKFHSDTAPDGKKADDIGVACVGSLNFNNNYPESTNAVEQMTGTATGGGLVGGTGEEEYVPPDYTTGVGNAAMISGATAAVLGGILIIGGAKIVAIGTLVEVAPTLLGGLGPVLGAFANVLAGAAIGFAVGMFLAKIFGFETDLAATLIVAGLSAFLGGYVGYSLWEAGKLCINPLLCIIIIIIIIVLAILFKIMGIGNTEKVIVDFKCQPWQAPTGGKDCDKCNGDVFKPCSKYRCSSLGQACKFINEGTEKELCIASVNDGKAPIISPWEEVLSEGYNYESMTGGIKVVDEDSADGCISAFTPIQFGIKTDKASQCKYDVTHKLNIDEMSEFFGDSNLYEFNHSMAISLPSVESIAEQYNVTTEHVREIYGNLKFLVRCQDDWGNGKDSTEYLIKICVKPGEDTTPPRIVLTEPANNAFIKFNETQQEVNIYTNEPANCKYDSSDKDYSLLTKTMSCETDLEDQGIYGWKCSTNLGNLTAGDNKRFIRCKDKPWLPEENETRFVNQQGYEYTLKKSVSELKILSIEPNGTLSKGENPFPVELAVTTSGGAENGKSTCYYQWADSWIRFLNTFSSSHTQPGLSLFAGSYVIPIKCEDAAGNTAQSSSNFILKLDTTGPKITRVYNLGGSLYIYTNENSDCAYSFSNCRFKFDNGTQMDGGFSQAHTTEWKPNIYYIKCRDVYGNQQSSTNNSCSIIVRPS